MTRRTHPLADWLGPALHDLTDDQLDRLTAESARIDERYPDPDEQPERDAALSAAMQYLLGETTAADVALELDAARRAVEIAMAAAQQVGVMLYDNGNGLAEIPAAAAVHITRRTLRRALGKDED